MQGFIKMAHLRSEIAGVIHDTFNRKMEGFCGVGKNAQLGVWFLVGPFPSLSLSQLLGSLFCDPGTFMQHSSMMRIWVAFFPLHNLISFVPLFTIHAAYSKDCNSIHKILDCKLR